MNKQPFDSWRLPRIAQSRAEAAEMRQDVKAILAFTVGVPLATLFFLSFLEMAFGWPLF